MTRWERFFFWLGRFNAVAILLMFLFVAAMLATEFYRSYEYRQEFEETRFGHADDEPSQYSAESIETSGGEIAAYYPKAEQGLERMEGSDITLVDPRTGRTRKIAGSADAWVVNWELIFRQGEEGGVAIGYLARVVTEEQYAAGKFDLVVGNLPALQQKVVARNVDAMDLPTVSGDTGAAFILWTEHNKAAFVAIDLRDLRITQQRDIPLPAIRENKLSQGPGPRRNLRADMSDYAPVRVFAY